MANANIALDLDLFDTAKSSYVPAGKPQREKVKEPELLKEKPASRKAVQLEEKQTRSAAVRACAFALFALMVIGSLIYCRVILTDLQVKLNSVQSEYEASKSEYTSLQMKYNSLLTPDKVEEYARDELGMVKLENYQVRYFDMSGGSAAQ